MAVKADSEQPSIPQGRWKKYACGAALMYGICVFLTGPDFSNEFWVIIQSGLVMGSLLFLIFGPAHFLLQLLAYLTVGRLRRKRGAYDGVIINIPALLAFVSLLTCAMIPTSPAASRRALQSLFDQPLPSSLTVKAYHKLRGMDGAWLQFLISAQPGGLDEIVTNAGWSLGSSNDYGARISFHQQWVKELSKGAMELQPPCAIYFFQTNDGPRNVIKTITLSSNRLDAFVTADFY